MQSRVEKQNFCICCLPQNELRRTYSVKSHIVVLRTTARYLPVDARKMVCKRNTTPMTITAVLGLLLLILFAILVLEDNKNQFNKVDCVDRAALKGLRFRGRYGKTIADTEGGTIMQRNMGNGAAVGDFNGDGYLDIYLLGQAGQPNQLYRNDPDSSDGGRRFTNVTEEAGVGDLGLSRAAHFADLNGDGWLDLALFNDVDPEGRLPKSRLYYNQGGTFQDVTDNSGFDPIGYLVGGATLIDYDLDGDLDIYVSFWTMEMGATIPGKTARGSFPGTNVMYRNNGGFSFTDVTDAIGLGGISKDSFTAIFHDFDSDGDLDLYQAVDHLSDLYFENRHGYFVDTSLANDVTHVGNDMGIAVADVDGDGSLDLFITNIADPEENFGKKPRGNSLLMPQTSITGLRFTDNASTYKVRDTGWAWGTSFVDIDLDGDLDLYVVQGFDEFVSIYSKSLFDQESVLFLNDGNGIYDSTKGAGCEVGGDQRSLVAFDYDRDGDADLLITQVGLDVILLENMISSRNWLTVKLVDENGRGSGARVDLTVAGRKTSQFVVHGASYLSGPPLEAYFGLGNALVADEIRVTDVRGVSVMLHNVSANQILAIHFPIQQ